MFLYIQKFTVVILSSSSWIADCLNRSTNNLFIMKTWRRTVPCGAARRQLFFKILRVLEWKSPATAHKHTRLNILKRRCSVQSWNRRALHKATNTSPRIPRRPAVWSTPSATSTVHKLRSYTIDGAKHQQQKSGRALHKQKYTVITNSSTHKHTGENTVSTTKQHKQKHT